MPVSDRPPYAYDLTGGREEGNKSKRENRAQKNNEQSARLAREKKRK
jgi:hypothetical protein